MKVYLTSAYHYKNYSPANWLKTNSKSDTWFCTDDPVEADMILFVESHPRGDPYFRHVFKNKTYQTYKKKCVLYHDADLSVTPMPTISPSIELWQHNPKYNTSAHYIARYRENKTIDNSLILYDTERKFLYSFLGSKTHAIRNTIFSMEHPRNTFIKDTTGLHAWELNEEKAAEYENEFKQKIDESYFILCPCGIGPSTYRLFEAMQLGRVPVIISDSWVQIQGIDWDKCSIRIEQANIHSMAEKLSSRINEAVEMGKNARKVWEDNFSPEVSLERIADAALKLISKKYSYLNAFNDHLHFLRKPFHLKNLLRYKKNKLKRKYGR